MTNTEWVDRLIRLDDLVDTDPCAADDINQLLIEHSAEIIEWLRGLYD